MAEQQRRWRFLEDFRAVTLSGWLPPAEDCPALADLKGSHERVLGAAEEASRACADLVRQREAELESVRAAEEESLLRGGPVDAPPVTVSEDEIAQARVRAEAARDALQRFAQSAIEQVRELEPEIVEAHQAVRVEAAEKRAAAEKLLAEADRLEETPKRIELWLERFNGKSQLGPFPYEDVVAPPPPEPLDLNAVLAGGTFAEVMVNA